MSAWLCSNQHLTVIATALFVTNRKLVPQKRRVETAYQKIMKAKGPIQKLGEMLLTENLNSLHHRYGYNEGSGKDFKVVLGVVDTMPFKTRLADELVAVLKLTKSYQYQTCEDEKTWNISLAKELTDQLIEQINLELLRRSPQLCRRLVDIAARNARDITFAEVSRNVVEQGYSEEYAAAPWSLHE